ncbi:TIR domain-containing protein [Paenibacillus qinlingensis]|uniref:TIR domain-containing protein n=1 Tax=Paenibacillus qinlingensis TaxID=1837343 RepID=UPI001563FBA1|nr:TIR domain-containing protein [Paenibacillus qinlingensis]NQX59969.1 TIR domain-containing protein [Paenibacillus qinlingensis]
MSIDSILTVINRLQKDIAHIQKKMREEDKNEAQKLSRIVQIERSITKSTSVSTYSSKMNEISKLQKDITKISSKRTELSKKLVSKTVELKNNQKLLSKEQELERLKRFEQQIRLEREQLAHDKTFDLFISHASEDKEEFVSPLVMELEWLGIRVCYDEFTLKVGDIIRGSIEKGLIQSTFGIVVFSSSIFKKYWSQHEHDGLFMQAMTTGTQRIWPIWHKVSRDEVMYHAPSLVDNVILNSSSMTTNEIAKKLSLMVQVPKSIG